jgi:hypothetical protein
MSVSIDAPICRAAVRDGRVTLNRWTPSLVDGGPAQAGLRTVTAALADLRTWDGELIVTPVAPTPWTGESDEAVLRWAATVGYRRVWLPSRMVDLDGFAQFSAAAVDCPTCGARWEDQTVDFWENVRRNGWFPGFCLACGGSLPEWEIADVSGNRFERESGAPAEGRAG